MQISIAFIIIMGCYFLLALPQGSLVSFIKITKVKLIDIDINRNYHRSLVQYANHFRPTDFKLSLD